MPTRGNSGTGNRVPDVLPPMQRLPRGNSGTVCRDTFSLGLLTD
ncbi:hypothetical protein [Streptomyces sp. NPDC102283]